jgi:hypothetical protein
LRTRRLFVAAGECRELDPLLLFAQVKTGRSEISLTATTCRPKRPENSVANDRFHLGLFSI